MRFHLVALALVPLFAHAHPGGLNASGCHNNRKTGDYHCHRGASSRPRETRLASGPAPASITAVPGRLAASSPTSVSPGGELVGRVVGVHDGDTLTVLTSERRQVRVRLAEVDTPESAQPFGTRAKQALSDLVFGRQVRVVVADTDRYGRLVGRVHQGAVDVNMELVSRGAAWCYRQYLRERRCLQLEEDARVAQRGLWAQPESQRTPPWEWRRAKRAR